MREDKTINKDQQISKKKEVLEAEPIVKSVENLQEAKRMLEEYRKTYERTRALYRLLTFIILVAAVSLTSFAIFIVFGEVESDTLKIVTAVIGGLGGLLGGVGFTRFFEDRQRRHQIEELRAAEKDFFERIKRDLSSRSTEKVR